MGKEYQEFNKKMHDIHLLHYNAIHKNLLLPSILEAEGDFTISFPFDVIVFNVHFCRFGPDQQSREAFDQRGARRRGEYPSHNREDIHPNCRGLPRGGK